MANLRDAGVYRNETENSKYERRKKEKKREKQQQATHTQARTQAHTHLNGPKRWNDG